MTNLVIVESPTKAKTLSKFLDTTYQLEATMGHLRDLPKSKLGIHVENQKFIPHYIPIVSRRERIKQLKKLSDSASHIILATDPDREGEAIAWHVMSLLSAGKSNEGKPNEIHGSKFSRIVFHEITPSAIDEALKHPRSIDMQLVDAQQTRRVLDRLVGYKLSPLLWNKLGKRWLSAGRVQSVAVRLIVEREREIEAFVSQEYWIIQAELEKEQILFTAKLVKINEQKADIKEKQAADTIVDHLKSATYTTVSVETKETRRFPYAPFTTSTLQQAAANKFGWSAKRTIQTAQNLYEEGFITYHRTDSTNLSVEALQAVKNYIVKTFGEKYSTEKERLYKTKSKVAQEAHEAVRPTKIEDYASEKELVAAQLGREAFRLYELISKRFIACQMREAVYDETRVLIQGKLPSATDTTYLLQSNGIVMKFDGWKKVYEDEQRSDGEEYRNLPVLSDNEILQLKGIIPSQKFTEPPARYNEASLIKILEEKGIGRPSTYAPIITTIQDRKYVEKIERKFHPTDLGKTVSDFLVQHFPVIFDIGFTAKMEEELDSVANGEMEWNQVVADFYEPFIKKLDTVFRQAERVKVDLGTTDEKCPECGSQLAIKMSKYGKFLACSNYPACKFTKSLVEKAGIPCPRCGGDIIVKKTRRGKQFYGCSNYPKCTFAAWKKEDIK